MVQLPDELAPRLREAAERLLAEVGEADDERERLGREKPGRKCWKCGGRGGPMSLHHLDNGKVVFVHRRCHRKIHGQAGKRSRKR